MCVDGGGIPTRDIVMAPLHLNQRPPPNDVGIRMLKDQEAKMKIALLVGTTDSDYLEEWELLLLMGAGRKMSETWGVPWGILQYIYAW